MNRRFWAFTIGISWAFSAAGQSTASAVKVDAALAADGKALFVEKCGFCHGPDTAGGESGPDLTRSRLVGQDKDGNLIGPVVKEGRVSAGMPAFAVSDRELSALATYIHAQRTLLEKNGQRRGVDEADLQTGNAEAGKRYFNGDGKCASCHSPTGDLAGLASRLKGLRLEQRMLNPGKTAMRATIVTPDGKTVTGKVTYQDEFVIGLTDATGWYRSWPTDKVKVTIDDPAHAHIDLLTKYTDEDIHNLMAYLQTFK